MKRITCIALASVALLAAPLAAAQTSTTAAANAPSTADVTDMQKLREETKADKRALVADTLHLSDAEAKRFWPIYDTYQRSLDETSRRRVLSLEGLMFRESTMTNLAAKRLVAEWMALDEAEVRARRTLRNRLMRALPAVKAARYLQLEDKIEAVRDYDMAATVPLVH